MSLRILRRSSWDGYKFIVARPVEGRVYELFLYRWFDGVIIHINNPNSPTSREEVITYYVRICRLMRHFIDDVLDSPFEDFAFWIRHLSDVAVTEITEGHEESDTFVSDTEFHQLAMSINYSNVLGRSVPYLAE